MRRVNNLYTVLLPLRNVGANVQTSVQCVFFEKLKGMSPYITY